MRRILFSWIGNTDLKASEGQLPEGDGPISQAVVGSIYDEIHLLSDTSKDRAEAFKKWLGAMTTGGIKLHMVKLSSPTNYREIYERAVAAIEGVKKPGDSLTFHLSPGTPAMGAIWLLLGKSVYPANLIQSSREQGLQEADVPFDIAAEFIPQLLQRSDERLTSLAQGGAGDRKGFADIIHRSPTMKRVIDQARRAAIRNIPVLIEGESGTGKELMAKAIHAASLRANGPFVPVNCGAIPPELVESEFFGHKKGAFTGAATDRKGHFEQANGGTIFLDEIGELPKMVQVKLLRTLQQGEVTRVGESEVRTINVRVIAATNRTLADEVANGRFREDLFYRLAVAIIRLPPLRERSGDLTLLIDALLEQVNAAASDLGIKHKKLSAGARTLMLRHCWPGNIRELGNAIQRAAMWSDDESISAEAMEDSILSLPLRHGADDDILHRPIGSGVKLEELLGDVARHYIVRAMEHTKGNKTKAAELLGFGSYQRLGNWMNRYGIEQQ